MKVKMVLSIGYSNAKREDILDFPDDTSMNALETAWQDWANNYIDGGPTIISEVPGEGVTTND